MSSAQSTGSSGALADSPFAEMPATRAGQITPSHERFRHLKSGALGFRLDNRLSHMTVTVGRIRPDPIFDVKLVAMGHNVIRGAAGASVLNAELMARRGLLDGL